MAFTLDSCVKENGLLIPFWCSSFLLKIRIFCRLWDVLSKRPFSHHTSLVLLSWLETCPHLTQTRPKLGRKSGSGSHRYLCLSRGVHYFFVNWSLCLIQPILQWVSPWCPPSRLDWSWSCQTISSYLVLCRFFLCFALEILGLCFEYFLLSNWRMSISFLFKLASAFDSD